MNPDTSSPKTSLSIPVAIVIAGALIAFGIYWTGRGNAAPQAKVSAAVAEAIKPVQASDHVLGDRNAKVMIVEYSDTECPFCKNFHNTLHQLVADYPGKVAWAFRHFPVHTKSVHEGSALECAAELGGNDAFWKYADKVFAATNSNDSLDPALLPQFAKDLGLDVTKFNACLDSGKYEARINQDKQNVIDAGAQGTPYSVIFIGGPKGERVPISQGALPYQSMKEIVDSILQNS
ncbi:MAG TPA: thioredoxin domain-containing protein [Candidatus Paceibacterota bacterium]|nr:thioredoxin domain-containing protein [Candidatus Paceibacterota bacterium]